MPAHGTGRGRCWRGFDGFVVAGDAHHHVVMVVEGGIELHSGGGFPTLDGAWAVVVALWFLDPVRVCS